MGVPVKSLELTETGDGRQQLLLETETGFRALWLGQMDFEPGGEAVVSGRFTFKVATAFAAIEPPSIQQLVREDLVERERLGRSRYGTPLYPFNGRDGLRDLYEELMDACCYVKQLLVEAEAGDQP